MFTAEIYNYLLVYLLYETVIKMKSNIRKICLKYRDVKLENGKSISSIKSYTTFLP